MEGAKSLWICHLLQRRHQAVVLADAQEDGRRNSVMGNDHLVAPFGRPNQPRQALMRFLDTGRPLPSFLTPSVSIYESIYQGHHYTVSPLMPIREVRRSGDWIDLLSTLCWELGWRLRKPRNAEGDG